MAPDDDDRIYFLNTDWLRENVRLGKWPMVTVELMSTDDPDRYTMCLTAPLPKVYIKRSKPHVRGDDWELVDASD